MITYNTFRNVETIYDLTIMDDYMAFKIFGDKKVVSEFLSVILKKPVNIVHVRTQVQERPRKGSHYVIYDVLAIDDHGNIYNIEIQDYDEKDLILRMTYNAGILVTRSLKKGEKYSQLRKTTVIALCSDDPVGSGETYYESEYPFEKYPDKKMEPRNRMIALNARGKKSSGDMDIDQLMDYIKTNRRNNGRLTVLLDDARRKICADEKEQEAFMTELYQGQNAGDRIAREENKQIKKENLQMQKEIEQMKKEDSEKSRKIALRLHDDGMDIAKIARMLDADPCQIDDWIVRENEASYHSDSKA